MIKKFIKKILKKSFDENLKFSALHYAMKFVSFNKIEGDYLEFGVGDGYSFVHAYKYAQEFDLKNMRFFAFDGFKGLPRNEGVFQKGSYKCNSVHFMNNIVSRGVDKRKVILVKGLFNKILNSSLKQKPCLRKASVIHIDCDLYYSAIPVFDFITDLIQDRTVILVHDWFNTKGKGGVQKSFKAWIKKNDFKAVHFHDYDWCGKSFILRK